MKNFFKIVSILFITSLFFNCSKDYQVPDNLIVQDFVWKGLNAYYLHQNEIADLSDRRFNSDQQLNAFLSGFTDYNSLFSSLLITSDTKSTLIEDYTNLDVVPLRTADTNGMEFGLTAEPGNTENVLGYVSHILPNSDASTKNIERGEFFNAVDGIQLTRDNYLNLLFPTTSTIILEMVDFDGIIITPNTKQVTLERLTYNYAPISLEKTFAINTDNIGYLMYNNDFSTNYINDLNNTFLSFKNQSVNELILDLRYNVGGGSFAKNVSEIAAMITGQFTGETIIKEEWNSKAQPWFLANQPDSLITKFPLKLNPTTNINSLNLTDVYIVLNGNNFTGSSAIELLINSLKSHITVHVIGNQTAGNNTGAITLYNSEDYDFINRNETHTVALQPIVLSFLNKNDETYTNGFTPTIDLCTNEDILNLGVLGETSDPILDRVLNYVSSGTIGTSNCNPNNFEFIYNSIDTQRVTDNGVFIKQNLPNTN
ncbi:MAG: S41 family peptidase [Polaribacter sp.]|uniref:S41 family peptidase n=1 Tax=Polaribacter sp. TaxID=1920175 RepID=UPI002F358098